MKIRRIAWVLAAALLLPPVAALASGTYRGGAPRAPASVDREAYDQGKRVFAGTAATAAGAADRDAQMAVLSDWQGKLPERVSATKDLTEMAGTLSDDQLASLGYFLKLRYKIE